MRRRAKRDLLTLTGVVLVLGMVLGVNTYLRLEGLKEKYEEWRMTKEKEIEGQGFKVLKWDSFRKIKGKNEPQFPDELKQIDGEPVNLCGFMSPINQFSDVEEFMLLPVPMTCYFCDAPPMRDIVHVKLAERGRMVEEPIVVGGYFKVAQEKKPKFFTEISPARWNQAIDTEKLKALTDKTTSEEHKKHLVMGFDTYFEDNSTPEQLESGQAVPKLDEKKLLETPAQPAAPAAPAQP